MYINKREYEVAKQLGRVIHSKVYLLNFKLQRVAEISGVVLDGASFTNDATSDIRRTCSISIVPTDSSFDLLSGDMDEVADYYASNTKIWLDKYFQVFIGLEDKDNNNKIEYTNMGIYLIDNPTQAYSAEDNTLTINGVDMMSKLTGLRNGQLEGIPYQIPKDSDIQDVIISALNEAKIPKYNIPKPSFINSGNVDECPMEIDIGIGDTVYGLISKLAEINSNFQMYFDVNGVFNYNMIPSGHNEPIMVTDDIWNKVLISYAKSVDYENVKNVIEVYGKTADNGKTPTGYAWDNNPYSPFYVGYVKGYPDDPDYAWTADNYVDMLQHAPNVIRQVCNGGEYDNIQIIEGSSINLAQDRAEYELYLRCKLQDQIQVECVPLYWLDTNWLISITLPNKNRTGQEPEKYIIKSITTTLGTDSSQSITMMKYYPFYDFELENDDPNPIVQPIVEDDPIEDNPTPTEPTNPSNPSSGGNTSGTGGNTSSSNPSQGSGSNPSKGGNTNPSKDNPSPSPTNPSTGGNVNPTDPSTSGDSGNTDPKEKEEDDPTKKEDEPKEDPIVADSKCYGYTSGERFLMESLDKKLSFSTDKGLYGNAIIKLGEDGVDKIQSLTAKVSKPSGAFVTLFGCDLKEEDVLSDSEERTYVLDEHKSNIIGLQNNVSEKNSSYCTITITSFTTTDGVVHTSENANYEDDVNNPPKEKETPPVINEIDNIKCYGYTTGERFLMNMLNNQLRLSSYENGIKPSTKIDVGDMSKIHSINAKIYCQYADKINLFGNEINKRFLVNVEKEYKIHKGSNSIEIDYFNDNEGGISITITSFTTTDGVTHTLDNINYEDDVNNPPLPIKPAPVINEIDGVKCYGYTSGERFLMESLNNQLKFGRSDLTGENSPTSTIDLKDMSKIHSISAKIYCNYEDEINLFGNEINKRFLVGVEEEYKIHKDSHSIVMKALSNRNSGISITITSFTTTDGIVHTSDNINYEDDV